MGPSRRAFKLYNLGLVFLFKLDRNYSAFFALVKAGLWECDAQLVQFGEIDYNTINKLAEEQSVVGLVAAGIEHVVDTKVPKEDALRLAGTALQLEQRNIAMNNFVGALINKMHAKDIFVLLVKGQGIAQCYERPLWRASGDVDLFLNGNDYQKAADFLKPLASTVDEENKYNKHLSMAIDSWVIELHGTLRSGLWKSIDRAIDEVQKDVFYNGKVRSWNNGKTQVLLPGVDEDIILVFTHILQHYYQEGVGLRQICDWCRLLWTFRSVVDNELLERRIRDFRIMSEWKVFASLAVNILGMPSNTMPFYSDAKKWKRKAGRVVSFIFSTGNFGHNRDYSYYKTYPPIIYKTISFGRHTEDFLKYVRVFPWDSVKVYWNMINKGIMVMIRGN